MNSAEKIEKELYLATGIKPKEGEADQEFRARLLHSISKISTDVWDNLSRDSQMWYNKGANALNHARPIPDFSGEAPPSPPRATTLKGVARPKESNEKSATERAIEILVETPEIRPEELMNKLTEESFICSKTTLTTIMPIVRTTLRVMKKGDKGV